MNTAQIIQTINENNENEAKIISKNKTDIKNCENDKNVIKKDAKYSIMCRNMSNKEKEKLWEKAQKTQLNIYVKTLLEAYRTLPNVIKILDQIIEKRASSAMLACSGIFSNTYDEIEKVIELSERKDKLLNLYIITDNMLKMLSEKQKQFAIMKFVKKRNIDAIAEELNITKRNVYRNANNLIKQLCIKMLERKWDSEFISLQIGKNEVWLDNIFAKKQQEENANNKRAKTALENLREL